MSLDTEKLHKLRGKGFDTLYDDNPEKWNEMVATALAYAKTCVPEGEKVKIGDIETIVQNAIKLDPDFERHLDRKHLTQRYWRSWFAEYVTAQVYPQELSD